MAVSILSVINFLMPKDRASRRLARDIPYGSAPRQKLDLYAPRKATGPLPVVFFIYGGSWMDGSRQPYEFAGRALAAQGFLTVVADYRLVPEVEYPGFLEDGALAMTWVVEHIAEYSGDPTRIALMGHSAGAYNASMLALDPRYLAARGMLDRVRCVVALSGPYDFFPFDGQISLRTFGAVREPRTTQPINHIAPKIPPMLLVTGDKDTLVLPRNTVAMAERLRKAGVEVEEIHYPKLAHVGPLMALAMPVRAIAPVLADATRFLRRHLS